ncbi:DUF2285 domain-containing protein [Acidovorax sp. JMULE5]|uniref:DUF2285 domain-containing protein n=1 Tax=Acidovorax sp. JMULE5 TaxID=2518343 RepID=UPI0015A1CA2F|nr:DUF2285 domain-containing protein [Acidovorax sp. JMULE5]QLA82519.1 DUF2285 domain-containing protein [Acidovorax sp. JMULE5]
MSQSPAGDLPGAAWAVSAAYLYTLDLDGPALAWEYLRRNPMYQSDWRLQRSLEPWGVYRGEDPARDAREARPLWIASPDALLHVRGSTVRSSAASLGFDLWRVPGRKRLVLGDAGLTLLADVSSLRVQVSLAGDLGDGDPYAVTVPLGPSLRGQLDEFNAQAMALRGAEPSAMPVRASSRAALLHLRALQALDGLQAGASHREIAQALFGPQAVAQRWQADGELRAQVRHLLRRAEAYMHDGYRVLAGVTGTAAEPPGDEPVR